MARQTPPAHIIAARGHKITLIDGTTPTVLFTFSSVMRLEDEFGSISGAVDAMGGVSREDGQIAGAAFGAIAKLLAAGLEHEVDAQGAPLSNVDTLRFLLDPNELQAYSTAIGAAFEAAFPSAAAADDEADPTKGAESSLGQSGTTSAPSSSDEQPTSSGA